MATRRCLKNLRKNSSTKVKKVAGDDDLEDSMSLLLSETSDIDFEKDLSEDSSQEIQEKSLLDEISMLKEDSSEDLDMDTLNDFLKDS